MELSNAKYAGIFPALVTPYTRDGGINESSLRRLVSLTLEKGVRGFYVTGSTGEAFLLTLDERKRILEVVAEENAGRGTLISHVGTVSTDQSVELARHAKQVGVDAVSSVPPFYYPFTVEEVIGHYLTIAESVDMPVLLYNFPANSGFTITPKLIQELRKRDKRIMGVKHTSMNLYDLEQALRIDDGFVVLSGHDEVLLGAMAMGARGAVGSTYNVMPELYVEMMAAFKRGDMDAAAAIQGRVNRFIRLMANSTGIPQIKAALELMGIECNGCRKPIIDLEASAKGEIERTLKEIGVL